MIYLFCYAASALLAYCAKKYIKNRPLFIALSLVSIFIPALLAGLRGMAVGVDTKNYYNLYWEQAQSSSSIMGGIKYSMEYFHRTVPEILFFFLVGIVSKLTGSYNLLLFLCHFIIVGCIYIGAFRFRDHAEPELTLLFFYFIHFGQSLNIMRQVMAMAVIFAFAADIEKNRTFRYLIGVAVAILIHNTAILGITPLIIYKILYKNSKIKRKYSTVKKYILCILIFVGTAYLVPIIRLFVSLGLMTQKYLWYINTTDENYTFNRFLFLFLIIEMAGLIVFRKELRRRNRESDFYFICFFAYALLNFVGSEIHYGDRLAEYFSLFNIVTICSIHMCQGLASNRRLMKFALISMGLVYWVFVYYKHDASETMPYFMQIY